MALLALIVGLCMLSPHYQMAYYLLVACGALDPLSRVPRSRSPAPACAGRASWGWPSARCCSVSASPRSRSSRSCSTSRTRRAGPADPAPAGSTPRSFSMPPEEIVTTVLPQFNGVLDALLGPQLLQAAHRVPRRDRGGRWRRWAWATGAGGGWCRRSAPSRSCSCWSRSAGTRRSTTLGTKLMPMMKKVRAPGHGVLPGGAARGGVRRASGPIGCSARDVPLRRAVLIPLGVLGGLALLGVVGVLQAVATVLASPEQAARVTANAAGAPGRCAPAARRRPDGGRRAVGGVARPAAGAPAAAAPRVAVVGAISGASTGCSSSSAVPRPRSSGTMR